MVLAGDAARRVTRFVRLNRYASNAFDVLFFQPQHHELLVVRDSPYVEKALFISVIDKRSGGISYVGQIDLYDLDGAISEEDMKRVLGGDLAPFGGDLVDELDDSELSRFFVSGGTRLDIGNPGADW